MKETGRARVVAGKYELEKLLGQGGMGEVWVAKDLTSGGKIALKLLKTAAADSKENRHRFEREARIATTLVSPHITRVSDSGLDEEGDPFMAMELLEGEDLQKRIKTEKVLPLAYVVRLAIQVGRALHVAHSAGLVHRDLKPANIFLARQGDDETVKVLDFGIAKGGSLEASEFTTAGAMLGTASYMSPEQIRNAKTVDHRADLWALAVVLFRALTGQFPFPETGFELFLALTQDPMPTPIRVTSLVPSLPGPLNVFFERSFVRDISQRYPTASAMIVGFCRAAGVTVPPDVLHAADAPAPSGPVASSATSGTFAAVPSAAGPASSGGYPAIPPTSGPRSTGNYPAVTPPSGPHSGAPPSPHSGAPPSPHSGPPASSTPVPSLSAPSHGPDSGNVGAGLSGTLMLDSSSLPDLDPSEPDNAATLFYQPGVKVPVDGPDHKAPPSASFAQTPPKPQVFTYPLDAARAAVAAAELPPAAPGQPTMLSGNLSQASRDAQALAAQGRSGGNRGARAAGLWITIGTIVLLLLGVAAALFFLKE